MIKNTVLTLITFIALICGMNTFANQGDYVSWIDRWTDTQQATPSSFDSLNWWQYSAHGPSNLILNATAFSIDTQDFIFYAVIPPSPELSYNFVQSHTWDTSRLKANPKSTKHSSTPHTLKYKRQFISKIIRKAAHRHQIDPALIKAVIMAESGYNPRAVSPKGAKGLMQLMPSTAKALGVSDCFNPELNIDGGAKYLKQLIDDFDGDIRLAIAAYNAGKRHVLNYQGVPPFKATRFYVKKVLKYYEIYKKNPIDDFSTV